ncbi:alpha/beta hydrolase [Pseudomaricurvus alkylphenolicus]|uniref:alpha/beta hydrolase n=1 Tax=Pseudomaricurvus alkylphenolicus TaxID=1306991 RepID=UPI001421D205|nr:alpha/beta hydrolase [Pseudomaricurvus alkylphenolicus]NIB38176.1 alpha/beta hydrolase [Pseudomaricurvus alkylphenolicus]
MKNVHPELIHYLKRFYPAGSGTKPSPYDVSVEDTRAFYTAFHPSTPEIGVGSVKQCHIPSGDHQLKGRIYTPGGNGPFPVIVHYHGGGYCFGSLDTHDAQCRHLCRVSECIVVAVDYRLAPEHKFPASQDDAYNTLVWAHDNAGSLNGIAERIALAGDSAGGNLTLITACRSRDLHGPKVSFLLPVVPAVKSTFEEDDIAAGDGMTLDIARLDWFIDQTFEDKRDLEHPEVNILGRQNLENLPPSLVVTAEFDILRPAGEQLAVKLREAGNRVEYMCADRMIHSFFTMSNVVPATRPFVTRAAEAVRAALYGACH